MALYNSTKYNIDKRIPSKKNGVYACLEVDISNKGIVDYLTYEVHSGHIDKEIWRCYEIKISNSDFHSKCKKTFVGDYNYYVMPEDLYNEVKDEIPKEIGVLLPVLHNNRPKNDFKEVYCIKKPVRQKLKVKRDIMIYSLIKSLSRETDKLYKGKKK